MAEDDVGRGFKSFTGIELDLQKDLHITHKDQASMDVAGYDNRNSAQFLQICLRLLIEIGLDELSAGKQTKDQKKDLKGQKKRRQEEKDDDAEGGAVVYGGGGGGGASKKGSTGSGVTKQSLPAADPFDTAAAGFGHLMSPEGMKQQHEQQMALMQLQHRNAMELAQYGGGGGGGHFPLMQQHYHQQPPANQNVQPNAGATVFCASCGFSAVASKFCSNCGQPQK